MHLAENYMITGGDPTNKVMFLSRMHNCLKDGITQVYLRAKQLSERDYWALAAEAKMLCDAYEAKLILNCEAKLVETLDADGIQLSSERLMSLQKRPLAKNRLVGASCHNLEELQHAEKIGADFATLSPVLPTASHPDAAPIGWDTFQQWVASVSLPVYALGGIRKKDLAVAKQHGAAGIAAIRAFWERERS